MHAEPPIQTGARPEAECLTCRINRGEIASPGGTIYRDDLWCLEHDIEPIALGGWLVLKPLRHVEAFADLTEQEAAAFGPLTRRITQVMTEVLRPVKIYLSMYMEAEGFAHLHVHLIPRFADTPTDHRGPRIFEYQREAKQRGPNAEMLAAAVGYAGEIRRRLREDAPL
jgi:diadenosine tetraphosphate (Ap4A) HIT family hydrolase